jgi:CBS domain-containing protein
MKVLVGTTFANLKASHFVPVIEDLPWRRSTMRGATLQAASRPLLALTATDLMIAPVMTIPQETSLREAAHLLSRSHISGAPVVDAEGRCLGVLSSSDFVTWADKGGETGEGEKAIRFLSPWGEWIRIEDSPDTEIPN